MTQYIFHIGPHKTGSTYLQNSFCRLRHEIAKRGVTYPKLWQTFLTGHHALAFDLRQKRTDLLRSGFRELANENVVLLSSEEFSRLGKQELILLKELVGSQQVHFVYYTRRWSELLPSCWQEDIKQGATDTLLEFYFPRVADPVRSHILNFGLVLDQFASVFGHETISIVSYSNLRDNKIDLLKHFLADVLRIPVDDFLLPPPSYPNTSLDYIDIEVIRVLNSLDQKRNNNRGPEIRNLYFRKRPRLDLRSIADSMTADLASVVIDDGAYAFKGLYSDISEKYRPNINGTDKRLFVQAKGKPCTYVRPGYLLNKRVVWDFERLYASVKAVDEPLGKCQSGR